MTKPAKSNKIRIKSKRAYSKYVLDDKHESVYSVINATDKPVRLQTGEVIGKVCPVEGITTCEVLLSVHSISQLIIEYQDIFLGPDGKLGRTDVITHRIETDASGHAIGAILSQEQENRVVAIAYASMFAVVNFLRHFRHYLTGRPLVVRTDHAILVWLKNFKDADGLLSRWLSIRETFDYKIKFRKEAGIVPQKSDMSNESQHLQTLCR
ncbi:POL3-like protein [Mya arenaria]|uniref:POL3-like protein n=1 Tax=Mya arenaria TaxID=6604 RepID=A0ABY7EFJ4_MYAAR|nr:POL3-like protein [Mya arenaria]